MIRQNADSSFCNTSKQSWADSAFITAKWHILGNRYRLFKDIIQRVTLLKVISVLLIILDELTDLFFLFNKYASGL